MPKIYSQSEKDDIKARLKEAAQKSLMMNGVKKTTVDHLVEEVHIPKGTFYLFYKSKEVLIFEVLIEFHEQFEHALQSDLSQMDFQNITAEQLTQFIFEFFKMARDNPLFQTLTSGGLEELARKLPPEMITEHFLHDDQMIEKILMLIPHQENIDVKSISAAFRDLFMLMFSDFYQEDTSLKMLIHGLVLQFIKQ